MIFIFLLVFIFATVIVKTKKYELFFQNWQGKTINELHQQYNNIFSISRNRNAASHLGLNLL